MAHNYETPAAWFFDAAARPQMVTDEVLQNRLKVAKFMRQLAIDAGNTPTDEMIADEMLLITGRMDREEFYDYIQFKEANGGWNDE